MQLKADFIAFGDLKNNHPEDHTYYQTFASHKDLEVSWDIKINYLFMSMRMCNVI